MRNLLVMAIALSVVINETDAKHLGYDVTEEDFRQYFEIPADAVVDKEAMTSNFKKDEGFSFDELKKFMTKKEQTLYKKTFPDAVEPAKSEDAPEVASAAKAEAKKKADEEKAKAAADKKAKKEAEAKAKAEAKAVADKAKADAKAAKEQEKADKAAAKAASAAAKKAIKPLSRSQEIMVYHSEGKDLAAIQELHPDWNASHIRNALFTAKNDAELVAATVQRKADYEAQEKAAAEAANQPAETVSADA